MSILFWVENEFLQPKLYKLMCNILYKNLTNWCVINYIKLFKIFVYYLIGVKLITLIAVCMPSYKIGGNFIIFHIVIESYYKFYYINLVTNVLTFKDRIKM